VKNTNTNTGYQPGSGKTYLHLQVQLKPLYAERMVKYLNDTVYSPHRT